MSDTEQTAHGHGSWGAATGIAAAVIIGVLVNILAARHYERFDWTDSGLYTLSAATLDTIGNLSEPLEITVLLATGDPLELTVRHLLIAYQAKSPQLRVRFVDPERDAAAFLAVQQKYSIALGRTASGQLISDAAVVVARGSRHHFIASEDLVAVDQHGARPRVERVFTAAIRRVLSGEAPQICFTSGHGEPSLEEGGAEGLLPLGGRLEKSNYAIRSLPPQREVQADDPINTCRVVIVAAPARPLPPPEVDRLVAFARAGGNIMVTLGPVPNEADAGYVRMGLGPLLAELGVKQHHDFIFERDDARRAATGFGETFIAELSPHRLTDGLMAGGGVDIVLTVASSLEKTPDFSGKLTPLLITSKEAFAMADFFAWAKEPTKSPEPEASDRRGPLTVAFASERVTGAKESDPKKGHSRAIVVSSSSVIYGANWQTAQLRGTSLFMESALSWLASAPIVLDIPAKPAHRAGLAVTKDMLRQILLQVVCVMPLSMLLLGFAIRTRRAKSKNARTDRSRTEEKDS